MAVDKCRKEGLNVSLAHIKYLNPFPKNLGEIIGNFKKVLIPELNLGQLKAIINSTYECNAKGFNKVQGLPFKISELCDAIKAELG